MDHNSELGLLKIKGRHVTMTGTLENQRSSRDNDVRSDYAIFNGQQKIDPLRLQICRHFCKDREIWAINFAVNPGVKSMSIFLSFTADIILMQP